MRQQGVRLVDRSGPAEGLISDGARIGKTGRCEVGRPFGLDTV